MRGTDRNIAAEALRDHKVKHVKAGYRCDRFDVEPFRPAGAQGR